VAAFCPKRVIALDEAHIVPVAEGTSVRAGVQRKSFDRRYGKARKRRRRKNYQFAQNLRE
jgi:hypothetical protein